MKRRSFLAWIAGLPFVGRLFSRTIDVQETVHIRSVQIETLLDFAAGRFQHRLSKDISKESFIVDTAFRTVDRKPTCDYVGAQFESLLFSLKEMRDCTDRKELTARIDRRVTQIAKSISFLVSVDETPDFLVRLFSLTIEKLSSRALELGLSDVSNYNSTENCLILRWSLSVKSGSSFWLDPDIGLPPMPESFPEGVIISPEGRKKVSLYVKPERLLKR